MPDLDGLLGIEILRRFTVTFDYAGRKLYLEPNRAFSTPFGAERRCSVCTCISRFARSSLNSNAPVPCPKNVAKTSLCRRQAASGAKSADVIAGTMESPC